MVYENIIRLCQERGISISTLEKNCNIGNGVVGGWRNSQPRLDKIAAVAKFFNVSVDSLMKEPEENK